MSEELKINIPVFNENEEAELENKLLFHLDEFTSEIMKTMTKDKDIIILKKVIERQQKLINIFIHNEAVREGKDFNEIKEKYYEYL